MAKTQVLVTILFWWFIGELIQWNFVSGACTGEPDVCDPSCECTKYRQGGIKMKCLKKGDKQLAAVPHVLPSNLVHFYAFEHNITYIGQKDFDECTSLRYLNVRRNSIRRVAQGAFDSLGNLTKLSLNMNFLYLNDTKTFPIGILDPLFKLERLWLDLNYWGESDIYREDLFRNKDRLQLLAIDGMQDAVFPSLDGKSLRQLNSLFIYNGIQTLSNATFQNWSHLPITHLRVHSIVQEPKWQLSKIERGACSVFKGLETLNLNYNPSLGFNDSLYQCMQDLRDTKIRKLELIGIVENPDSYAYSLPDPFTDHLKRLTNLTVLKIDWNGIIKVPMHFSKFIPHIRELSLPYNRLFGSGIYILNELINLKELTDFDISHQTRSFRALPGLLSEESPLFRESRYNPYGEPPRLNISVHLPPYLSTLKLSDTFDSGELNINAITIYKSPSHMQMVDLSHNKIATIEGPLIILPNHKFRLERLSLNDCSLTHIGDIFHERLKIKSLDLSLNVRLGEQITSDLDGVLMGYMNKSQVEILNLTLTNIKFIPPHFFSTITSLKVLVLKNSAIGGWYASFDNMKNLKFIDFSSNKFLYLLPLTTHSLDKISSRRNITVDISLNPLQIQCDSLYFLKWMRDTKVYLSQTSLIRIYKRSNWTNDKYFYYDNLTGIIQSMEVKCKSKTWLIVAGSSCGFAMLLLFLSFVIHRQRWDIRYFCLRLVRQRKMYTAVTHDDDYEYDAFVAYHQNDLGWVKSCLIPKIESDSGTPFRLCIHQRDWIPGHTIEENISESVEKSRKTIFIFSRNSLKSSWCEFELQMARMRSLNEGEEIIIVIALEDIPLSRMTRTMANLRRTSTWLDWVPEPGENQNNFWRLLREALSRPSDQPARCWCGKVYYPDGTENV